MGQNRSHAVMAQRAEPHDSLDFFPTPPWATRALCEWLEREAGPLDSLSCWEPAAGAGDMARPLREYFAGVFASDVYDRDGIDAVEDFLFPEPRWNGWDWIITNPPFRLGQQFAETAIRRARSGVAVLVRTAFLESAARFDGLFGPLPPSDILQFVERVPMFKGHLDANGSTATAYCWLVWRQDAPLASTRFRWIAPCRKRLERPGDYPDEGAAA